MQLKIVKMKTKLLCSLLLLSAVTNSLFSQTPAGKEEFEKKQKEKTVIKPPAYDSTETLEEQYKLENQYQFIGLQLYLPPIINPEAGPIVFSKAGNGLKGNKNYTIIDILQGNPEEQLQKKNAVIQSGYRYKQFNSPQWKDLIVFVVFVLRDNNNKDSLNSALLYWVVSQSKTPPYSNSYFNSFIAIPYLVKQKQLYENQEVIKISDKSKWICSEAAVLKNWNTDIKDSTYEILCQLKNDKGIQILMKPPTNLDKLGRSFMTEKEFIRLDHADRNQKEAMYKAESEKKEKHKAECINKFGQHFGELAAQGNIEIGMTADMCKAAWGAPWNNDKATNSKGTIEHWFYNWKYKLYFENGILVKIEH